MNYLLKTLSSLSLAVLIPLLIAPAHAQFSGPKVATATAIASPTSVAPGGTGILLVTVNVGAKYHINAHQPNDPAYIATLVTTQKTPGITYGPAKFPTPKAMKLSYAPKPLLVYVGKAVISVPFTVAKTAKRGTTALKGAVSFQGCDARSCYPPASVQVSAPVTIK